MHKFLISAFFSFNSILIFYFFTVFTEMSDVINPAGYPDLCRAINSDRSHRCPGHFRTRDEKCKYASPTNSHLCVSHGIMTDEWAFEQAPHYLAARNHAAMEDRQRKSHGHAPRPVPLMEIRTNGIMPENEADRTVYRARMIAPRPEPLQCNNSPSGYHSRSHTDHRISADQRNLKRPSGRYSAQPSVTESSSSGSSQSDRARGYANAAAARPLAQAKPLAKPHQSRYDVQKAAQDARQANVERGRSGQAEKLSAVKAAFSAQLADVQNRNPTNRRPTPARPAKPAPKPAPKPARDPTPASVSSKDGRDNPTPAMPPNLLVNPFAPQAKKRTKPSAKQRAKNRAARAASQQSPPAQVVPPADMMEVEISVEAEVADILLELAESVAASSIDDFISS